MKTKETIKAESVEFMKGPERGVKKNQSGGRIINRNQKVPAWRNYITVTRKQEIQESLRRRAVKEEGGTVSIIYNLSL